MWSFRSLCRIPHKSNTSVRVPITVQGRPGKIFIKAKFLFLRVDAHLWIFLYWVRDYADRVRMVRCIIVDESPLRINSLTTKAQCSHHQAMVHADTISINVLTLSTALRCLEIVHFRRTLYYSFTVSVNKTLKQRTWDVEASRICYSSLWKPDYV